MTYKGFEICGLRTSYNVWDGVPVDSSKLDILNSKLGA